MFDNIFKMIMVLTVIGLLFLFVFFLVKYIKYKSVSLFYALFWGICAILAFCDMIDIWGTM